MIEEGKPMTKRAGVDVFGVRTSPTREGGTMAEIRTDRGGKVELLTGDEPYLWIGGRDNRCVGIIEGDDLVKLRDALNALVTADA